MSSSDSSSQSDSDVDVQSDHEVAVAPKPAAPAPTPVVAPVVADVPTKKKRAAGGKKKKAAAAPAPVAESAPIAPKAEPVAEAAPADDAASSGEESKTINVRLTEMFQNLKNEVANVVTTTATPSVARKIKADLKAFEKELKQGVKLMHGGTGGKSIKKKTVTQPDYHMKKEIAALFGKSTKDVIKRGDGIKFFWAYVEANGLKGPSQEHTSKTGSKKNVASVKVNEALRTTFGLDKNVQFILAPQVMALVPKQLEKIPKEK